MRLCIDWELCIGSGQCVSTAPSAFRLVPFDRGYRAVLAQATGDDIALLAAAEACPTLAIRLADNLGEEVFPPPLSRQTIRHLPSEDPLRTADQRSAELTDIIA